MENQKRVKEKKRRIIFHFEETNLLKCDSCSCQLKGRYYTDITENGGRKYYCGPCVVSEHLPCKIRCFICEEMIENNRVFYSSKTNEIYCDKCHMENIKDFEEDDLDEYGPSEFCEEENNENNSM